VGVVVAAGTLQSVHRPATLEQAWRAAAGRALFRSPVLVEVLGVGCGWYDASQLSPVRDCGLSEEDSSELGLWAAALRRELVQLAASCVGHVSTSARGGRQPASGGAMRVFPAPPPVHNGSSSTEAALEKKRRLEAGSEQMDVEARSELAGDGDVDMAAPAASEPGDFGEGLAISRATSGGTDASQNG